MKATFNQDRIIAELANDNHLAIGDLFNYYYPRLYNFSKSFLKFDEGIDDILQEVFLLIWKNRKNITSSQTFNSYIYTITQNLLLNEIRRRLNNKRIKESIFKISVAEEFIINEKVEYEELKRKVADLIEALPEKQKEIFKLSRNEGLSHKEIAIIYGVSAKTIEYHIGQSIAFIKKGLKSWGMISLLYLYLFL